RPSVPEIRDLFCVLAFEQSTAILGKIFHNNRGICESCLKRLARYSLIEKFLCRRRIPAIEKVINGRNYATFQNRISKQKLLGIYTRRHYHTRLLLVNAPKELHKQQ